MRYSFHLYCIVVETEAQKGNLAKGMQLFKRHFFAEVSVA